MRSAHSAFDPLPGPISQTVSKPWIVGGATAAAVLTAVVRLPFLARYLWDHDSIQFALAVERFDLAAHQPHPPGYPLYIGLLEVLGTLGLGPLAAMNALSVLAAAAGAAALIPLVTRLCGPRAAALAVALYVFNPLLWFYGELPLVYAVEGGVSVVLAWAVAAMPESRLRFVLACGLLALAGGLRPSTLVLLFPLLGWGVVATWHRGRLTPGLFGLGASVGAVAVLSWLLPLLSAAGGWAAYRQISGAHFGALLPQTSVLHGAGWASLAHNAFLVAKWGAQGLVPTAAVVGVLWVLTPRSIPTGVRMLVSRGGFLAAWAVPPMLFFCLFHITKAGYTLVHLPALLIAGTLLAAPALSPLGSVSGSGSGSGSGAPGRRIRAVRLTVALALSVTVGGGLFLWGEDRDAESPRWQALWRHELNLHEIRSYERALEEALTILESFATETTVFATVELTGRGAAGSEGFLYPWHRHLQWYLPEAPVVYLVPEARSAERSPGNHLPFQAVPWQRWWTPGTRDVLWVLAGPVDGRFELPPGEIHLTNQRFRVVHTAPPAPVPGPGS